MDPWRFNFSKEEFGKIKQFLITWNQDGPLKHGGAGKAVAFHEALQPAFGEYIEQVVKGFKAIWQRCSKAAIRAI